jgi:hypothetical protein
MANPTTAFGWQMPTSSDLVTDLPADFETFGQAVDTSLADLKGGTTGQVLSKASNTDMDFTWVAQDDSNAIQNAIVDAKGDLIAATAADTPARLAVGTNGQVLTADSTAATGLAWTTPGGGSGLVLIRRSSFSNVANTGTTFDTVFSATYKNYLVVIENISAATVANDLHAQFRNGSTTLASDYYGAQFGVDYNSTSLTTNNTNNLAHMLLTAEMSPGTSLTFYASGVGGTTTTASVQGTGIDRAKPTAINYAIGYFGASVNVDGLIFKSSSSNITGTIAIYGLATS